MRQQIQCGIYNQQRVFQDISEVKENTEVILVLHIRGLKILKHSFHCDCYVSQIKVYQPIEERYNVIKDYSIIDEDDDDEGEIFSQEIKEAIEELKQEEQEKKEQEKLQKQKLIQEEKQRILQEIEQKQKELEKLLNGE